MSQPAVDLARSHKRSAALDTLKPIVRDLFAARTSPPAR